MHFLLFNFISIGLLLSASLQEGEDIQVVIPAFGRINLFKINHPVKKATSIIISFILFPSM